MTRRILAFVSAFLLPCFALAHNVSIDPVDVKINVEQDHIRVQIESAADYWIVNVLDVAVPPPPTGWRDDLVRLAKDEVMKSFELRADGRVLPLKNFTARYIEEPLRITSPRVRFDLAYVLPPEADMLSGRSRFFELESRRHSMEPEEEESDEEYFTRLHVSGTAESDLILPLENPEFQFPVSRLMKTPVQYAADSVKAAVVDFCLDPLWWAVCMAMACILRGMPSHGFKMSWISAMVAALAIFTAFLLGFHQIPISPRIAGWGMLAVITAPYALKRAGNLSLAAMGFACFFVWPRVAQAGLAGLPFDPNASGVITPAYIGGLLISAMVLTSVITTGLWIYRNSLSKLSESLAERILLSHLRTTCGFVLFVSLSNLIKNGLVG